ncbi:DUF6233 domain-containing protein [Streptomyces sp900116325]|uniref:DUF6233 domain-containing protein n=1 Tax=Streptomyces sp. 900116325 TaxID=3154295 RepID=UPI0033209A01
MCTPSRPLHLFTLILPVEEDPRTRQRGSAQRTDHPTPDWNLELGIGVGARQHRDYVGGCYTAGNRRLGVTREQALAALAHGIRTCIHCRPDTELG